MDGGIIKQRIARPGGGKSGGFRTVILYAAGNRAVFVYGYAKKNRDNITRHELWGFKELARQMLNYDEQQLGLAMRSGVSKEVKCDE